MLGQNRPLFAWPVAAAPGKPVSSLVYENSKILKTGPGVLLSLSGYNSKGSAQWIQIHDSATVPAESAVPLMILSAATVANFAFTLPPGGLTCINGITVTNSGTGPTKTIGSADCFFTGTVL